MTVSELMELLKSYPPSMGVFIEGYEGGYTPLKHSGTKILAEQKEEPWYNDTYKVVKEGDEKPEDEQALIFYR